MDYYVNARAQHPPARILLLLLERMFSVIIQQVEFAVSSSECSNDFRKGVFSRSASPRKQLSIVMQTSRKKRESEASPLRINAVGEIVYVIIISDDPGDGMLMLVEMEEISPRTSKSSSELL